MKQIILTLAFAVFGLCSHAQQGTDLTRNATPQKDTTIAKTVYKIYVGSRGGRFIIVTSKKGTQYKKYISSGTTK